MSATLIDFDGTFFRGAKSDIDPSQLPLGYYYSGINSINQGGVISCRPGYRCVVTFPGGNLQGAALFRPKVGLEQLVTVVDGRAFVAEYPFQDFRQLPDIQFSPSAKQIFFVLTEQSARRLSTGLVSAIEVIAPKAVMFMQDGGETAPAYYDGFEAQHVRGNDFETPIGSMMAWVGDRLWVASGSFLYASDISNPFSFREQIYLGGASAFVFSGEITGLATTPSLEFPQLLVFTEVNCSLLQANIRVRSQWLTTQDFQREVFSVGCSSQKSLVAHFGQLMWFSPSGIVFFDAALMSKQSARLPIRDNEMAISKSRLHGDLSRVAGGAFGQYMLMSVPAEDLNNSHTWVLNNASLETLSDASGPSWAGMWLGTRPVDWICGVIAGQERAYHVSVDYDGNNRLWEAFVPDRLDNGCPITWATEFRGYFGQTSQAGKPVGADCEMRYAEFAFSGIEGGLDVGAYYAGSTRGAYKQILSRYVEATPGSMDADEEITMDSALFAFKAQSRKLRTQDVRNMPLPDTGSCPVEQPENENIDESFQLMLVCHGPGTLRRVRVWASPKADRDTGDPATACGREELVKAVRFDGAAAEGRTFEEAELALSGEVNLFTSNQTETVSAQGFTSVGVGYAESIVSQEAADRVAKKIAQQMGEKEVIGQLPRTLSAGELYG